MTCKHLFTALTALALTAGVTAANAEDQKKKKGVTINANGIQTDGVNISGKGVTVEGEAEEGAAPADGKPFAVTGNSKVVKYTCPAKGEVQVSGNSHIVTLDGECAKVSVSGNSHVVNVDGVAKLSVSGNNNKVTWVRGVDGKDPKVSKSGNMNSVVKVERKM